jgi:hypothetical protein
LQEWTSINAQPDQANIFAVVEFFLKSAREEIRPTTQEEKQQRQVQL